MLPEAFGMAWRPVACGKSTWDQLGKDSILHAAGAESDHRGTTQTRFYDLSIAPILHPPALLREWK